MGMSPVGDKLPAGCEGSYVFRRGDNQHAGAATVAAPKTTAEIAGEAGMVAKVAMCSVEGMGVRSPMGNCSGVRLSGVVAASVGGTQSYA